MALIVGQVCAQMDGLVMTVDSDDVTGQIVQFTITNSGTEPRTLFYTRNKNVRSLTVQPGTARSFAVPQNGVKWLTDDIQWSVK